MFTTPAWLPKEYSTGYFYLDGHPSRYQPRPTGLNFGEQTGTGVFPLVIAVPLLFQTLILQHHFQREVQAIKVFKCHFLLCSSKRKKPCFNDCFDMFQLVIPIEKFHTSYVRFLFRHRSANEGLCHFWKLLKNTQTFLNPLWSPHVRKCGYVRVCEYVSAWS